MSNLIESTKRTASGSDLQVVSQQHVSGCTLSATCLYMALLSSLLPGKMQLKSKLTHCYDPVDTVLNSFMMKIEAIDLSYNEPSFILG